VSVVFLNWLKAPPDREVIRRWTRGGPDATHELTLPQPENPDTFEFLALGDSGDSDPGGARTSPQDAVARFLAQDAALPDSEGHGELVLHMGDVVYMTGERRLYDRNFRGPYAPFLTPGSTVDNLVFRLPFFPIPGNHDYYDFARWARLLMRTPVLGSSVRAAAREFFAFRVPRGGSGMGKAFMEAFVGSPPEAGSPLPYLPGSATRLPNRYYQFRYGSADFFALDSNTLEAPPPSADPVRIRREAAQRVRILEGQLRTLEDDLARDEATLDRWLSRRRSDAAFDPEWRASILAATEALAKTLGSLEQSCRSAGAGCVACLQAVDSARASQASWEAGRENLSHAGDAAGAESALTNLAGACTEVQTALRQTEACLSELPEGAEREAVLSARDGLTAALKSWSEALYGRFPAELTGRIRRLSETSLDLQRELARERRRVGYQPEDHDAAQLRWLDEALSRSVAERPDAWRVVYLHHPLYTTIGNHCEHPDVQGVRDNLLSLLRGRVDLVLTGHSHAFEWIRSSTLPETGVFVTGGGGQVSLRGSILDLHRLPRYPRRYEALRRAGALESASAGRGPRAADGEAGPVYHYLRIQVTPEALHVVPIGVRRLAGDAYRREEPLPVGYTPELGPLTNGAPRREERLLAAIEIRRGRAPRALWG
jgi:hypothetical protein